MGHRSVPGSSIVCLGTEIEVEDGLWLAGFGEWPFLRASGWGRLHHQVKEEEGQWVGQASSPPRVGTCLLHDSHAAPTGPDNWKLTTSLFSGLGGPSGTCAEARQRPGGSGRWVLGADTLVPFPTLPHTSSVTLGTSLPTVPP